MVILITISDTNRLALVLNTSSGSISLIEIKNGLHAAAASANGAFGRHEQQDSAGMIAKLPKPAIG
jgi:hypothetical protein